MWTLFVERVNKCKYVDDLELSCLLFALDSCSRDTESASIQITEEIGKRQFFIAYR